MDNASAEWLANQVRQSGAEPSLEPFTLNRVDPQSCYLRIAGRRIDGVPVFGLLGIEAYIKGRPDLIRRAHVWIFFGSDIGAPQQPNLIHASDDALEQWIVAAMEKAGLRVNGKARHDSAARGEAGVVQRDGGRFVTVACASKLYHSAADRWPEAVDVAALARYARAFANGASELAQQSS